MSFRSLAVCDVSSVLFVMTDFSASELSWFLRKQASPEALGCRAYAISNHCINPGIQYHSCQGVEGGGGGGAGRGCHPYRRP